jgi:saccharopine dehydrogenase-like NADP-dependent oxidoreductase
MHRVLLLGAGKIGRKIAQLLHETGDYDVLVADNAAAALAELAAIVPVRTQQIDVTNIAALHAACAKRDSVVSALSFQHNPAVAQIALEAGASYFDLTEDIATTTRVRTVAAQARPGQIFMPQCGLAPGFVSILAYDLTRQFDRLETVLLRVGALPLFPNNAMKYNLTWSTTGLINEYCNPCEAIHQSRRIEVLPLEGLEHFSLDGVHYEAFNTSGGLGTLCETLEGSVHELNYKTCRYLGHRELMAFLIHELRLGEKRELLREILESSIPITLQDVVVVYCSVTGWQGSQLVQASDARKVYHTRENGHPWSAIQITTASSLCAVLDLHVKGRLPTHGFVRQEQVPLQDFIENRFGKNMAGSAQTRFVRDAL